MGSPVQIPESALSSECMDISSSLWRLSRGACMIPPPNEGKKEVRALGMVRRRDFRSCSWASRRSTSISAYRVLKSANSDARLFWLSRVIIRRLLVSSLSARSCAKYPISDNIGTTSATTYLVEFGLSVFEFGGEGEDLLVLLPVLFFLAVQIVFQQSHAGVCAR